MDQRYARDHKPFVLPETRLHACAHSCCRSSAGDRGNTGASASGHRRSADRRQGGGAQSHRRLGLSWHGVCEAQAAIGGRRRSLRRNHSHRRRYHPLQAGTKGGDVWCPHLRRLPGLPRRPRQSLRKCRGHHGLPCRRIRPRIPQSGRKAGGSSAGRRQRPRRGLRADRILHRAAHAVRQCQTTIR